MHHSLRAAGAIIGVTVFVAGVPAYAERDEPPPEAVEAARRGRELFEAERYREAIVELEAAYDAFPAPPLLHNLGRCYEELDNHCEAASYYRRFLREGRPSGEVREDVVRSISDLEDRCDEEGPEEPDGGGEAGGGGRDSGSEPDPGGSDGPGIETRARLFDAGPTERDTTATDAAGISAMVIGAVSVAVGASLWFYLFNAHPMDCIFGEDTVKESPSCMERDIRPWAQGADAALWTGGILMVVGAFVYWAVPSFGRGDDSPVSLVPTSGGMALQLDLP